MTWHLDAIAVVGGAVLAESARPSETWRGSAVSVALGCAGGTYGPQGVEIWLERMERAHLLVTFLCGFLGATILKKLLEGAAKMSPGELWAGIGRAIDAFRRKTPEGGN